MKEKDRKMEEKNLEVKIEEDAAKAETPAAATGITLPSESHSPISSSGRPVRAKVTSFI